MFHKGCVTLLQQPSAGTGLSGWGVLSVVFYCNLVQFLPSENTSKSFFSKKQAMSNTILA